MGSAVHCLQVATVEVVGFQLLVLLKVAPTSALQAVVEETVLTMAQRQRVRL